MNILSVDITEGKSFTTKVNDVLSVKIDYLGDANYLITTYLYGVEVVKIRYDKSDITNVLKSVFQDMVD